MHDLNTLEGLMAREDELQSQIDALVIDMMHSQADEREFQVAIAKMTLERNRISKQIENWWE